MSVHGVQQRRRGLNLLALALPFAVLLLLEFALRGVGVGRDEQRLVVPVEENEAYHTVNASFFGRYFNESFVPEVAPTPFRAEKAPGTFRVVVVGGSSAAGYPYRHYLSFPARLQQRLEVYAAGQPVEVINLGAAAVSSYVLWDLRDEIVDLDPDAVLVYAGHNEYYGALGVGSSVQSLGSSIAIKRWALRFKHSVLYRGLERALAQVGREPDARSFMARSVANANIALDSPAYEAGVEQFDRNLRDLLGTLQEAGIPAYVGTVTSNLKDQLPLGDDPGATRDYEQGRTILALGDTAEARGYFIAAKEKDEIRFRAPEAINERIRQMADDGLAMLVDAQAAIAAHSPGGLEDFHLFIDHLHPDYRGYDHIANVYFDALRSHEAIQASGIPPRLDVSVRPDAFERSYAMLQVASLNAGFPFNKNATPESERFVLARELGRYAASRHYIDSLTVLTMRGEITAEEAIAAAIPRAIERGETGNALRLYRSLLAWRPLDETLHAEALAFAQQEAPADEVPIVEELHFFVANQTGRAEPLEQLAVFLASHDAARAEAVAAAARAMQAAETP